MAKRKAQGVVVKKDAAQAAKGGAPPTAAAAAAAKATAPAPEGPAEEEAEAEEEAPATGLAQTSGQHERRKKKRRRPVAEAAAPAAAASPSSGSAAASVRAPLPPAAAASRGAGEPARSPLEPGGERLTPTEVLEWLLWPMSPGAFFAEYWEKKPLHIRRGRPEHYGGLFAKADLDRLLRERGADFRYGERINLARFDGEAGRKISLNRGDRGAPAKASDVDAEWGRGASIQVMHPQQYHEPVWRLLASLERAFAALFGANAYLTPAGYQGLAPHFDDVEVLMLQLEGRKRWRLHAPPEGEEYPLPRDYSRDFSAGELGAQLLDCTVEPGDLLYLPRGTVHYGVTEGPADGGAGGPGSFSHHLTVSTYQKTAWCSLLERALLSALGRASAESADFRAGLPVGFLGYMGSWHDCGEGASPEAAEGRAAFLRRLKGLAGRLQDFIDADEVCDEFGVDFMSQRLPPVGAASSSRAENGTPAAGRRGAGGKAGAEEEGSQPAVAPDDRVRWLDPSAVRAMISTDPETSEAAVMLFHSCGNARGHHMCKAVEAEEEVGCLRFEAVTFLPAVRALYGTGDTFLRCSDLPLADEGDKVAFCENLLEAGLLERLPARA